MSDLIGMAHRHSIENRSPDSRGPEEHVVFDDPTRSMEAMRASNEHTVPRAWRIHTAFLKHDERILARTRKKYSRGFGGQVRVVRLSLVVLRVSRRKTV